MPSEIGENRLARLSTFALITIAFPLIVIAGSSDVSPRVSGVQSPVAATKTRRTRFAALRSRCSAVRGADPVDGCATILCRSHSTRTLPEVCSLTCLPLNRVRLCHNRLLSPNQTTSTRSGRFSVRRGFAARRRGSRRIGSFDRPTRRSVMPKWPNSSSRPDSTKRPSFAT